MSDTATAAASVTEHEGGIGPEFEAMLHRIDARTSERGDRWRREYAALAQLEELAKDVGRLRRTDTNPTLDRIAETIHALDAILQPTAGDLYRHLRPSVDEDTAVTKALAIVDHRAAQLTGWLA